MSVLILDMKFPKTCAACEWSRYSFPNAWCGRTHKTTDVDIAKNGRPDDCPLVPVPPHGRLIDENEVRKLLTEMISLSNSIVNGPAIIEWVADNITQCQTIIPAEEGET